MIFFSAIAFFMQFACAATQSQYAANLQTESEVFAKAVVNLVCKESSSIEVVLQTLENPMRCHMLPESCKRWVGQPFFVPVEMYSLANLMCEGEVHFKFKDFEKDLREVCFLALEFKDQLKYQDKDAKTLDPRGKKRHIERRENILKKMDPARKKKILGELKALAGGGSDKEMYHKLQDFCDTVNELLIFASAPPDDKPTVKKSLQDIDPEWRAKLLENTLDMEELPLGMLEGECAPDLLRDEVLATMLFQVNRVPTMKDLEDSEGFQKWLKKMDVLNKTNPAIEKLSQIKELLMQVNKSMSVIEKKRVVHAVSNALRDLVGITTSMNFIKDFEVTSLAKSRKETHITANMDWAYFWKDARGWIHPYPVKQGWDKGPDVMALLEMIFSKELLNDFKQSHSLDRLRSLEGFEMICGMADRHIEKMTFKMGEVSDDDWNTLEADFALSLSDKQRMDAVNALVEIESTLQSETAGTKRERDLYKLAVMNAMFDDLKNSRAQDKAFKCEHYAQMLSCLLNNKAVNDNRAPKFQSVADIAAMDVPLFVIKAPNGIYPAYACIWAASRNAGLLGSPFGFPIDVAKLTAHGGAFNMLVEGLEHDCLHIEKRQRIPLQPPIQSKQEMISLLKKSDITAMTPYYLVLFAAIAYNDRTLTDRGFFEFMERFVQIPKEKKEHYDENDRCKACMLSLLASCDAILKNRVPAKMQLLGLRSFVASYFKILNDEDRIIRRFPSGLFCLSLYGFWKYREYVLWAERFAAEKGKLKVLSWQI